MLESRSTVQTETLQVIVYNGRADVHDCHRSRALELAHLNTILWHFLFVRTGCGRSSDYNRARPMEAQTNLKYRSIGKHAIDTEIITFDFILGYTLILTYLTIFSDAFKFQKQLIGLIITCVINMITPEHLPSQPVFSPKDAVMSHDII